MDEVVIVSACRTPVGRFGGSLREIPAIELGALVMRETLGRVNVDPAAVDEVFVGVCSQGEPQDLIGGVGGRQALMKAGLPPQTVSVTLDRACCSSMTAIGFGCRAIYLGEAEIVLAGGIENMSRVPHDPVKEKAIHEKLNVNGGAIAIGHPVGASGARITMTLIYELRRRGGGYGAAAICGGLAQGDAIIVRAD